ncbi:TerC family protein [Cryptosporangium phraense]|uniref:TerC family protein n=1 Tax=Cryptosporangium phraense TaxID=2593070 RepID=A0A545AJP8_9ACTN|nr:TerC family protein [Cryptosporangium phraense]TQS41519.1 TerC family protein [Cryptosporangium phraense]
MDVPAWVEWGVLGTLFVLLAFDVWVIGRRPHEPSIRESTLGVIGYVAIALIFGVGIWWLAGGRYAGEYYAGWLTEYSLSVDNLFVFLIIMSRFKVPRIYQQKVLLIGIILALVLRGLFIAAGAAAIERFIWVFFLFGGFLLYTAWNLAFHHEDEEEFKENVLIRWSRRVLPISKDFGDGKLRTREKGKRLWTPMVVVLIAIGTTDLLFAFDSIPAIFGLTREPFLIFTANVFALMGLRQLYFLLGGLLDRLIYLSVGLAFILAFIGVKLILEALHENTLPFINGGHPVEWVPEVPIWASLVVIVGTLGVTTLASLWRSRRPASDRELTSVEH